MTNFNWGIQQQGQPNYESDQSEAVGVSEQGISEEDMDTSEGSTDGHKEMETNDAGKYFKRPGMEEKGEIGYQHIIIIIKFV